MMVVAVHTQRAAMTPIFSMRKCETTNIANPKMAFANEMGFQVPIVAFSLFTEIRNVGQGPAILLRCWHCPVSADYTLDGRITVVNQRCSAGTISQRDLVKGETAEANFKDMNFGQRYLVVVESSSAAGGTHQWQLLLMNTGEQIDQHWTMVHAIGDSTGERVITGFQRLSVVIDEINKILDKFD